MARRDSQQYGWASGSRSAATPYAFSAKRIARPKSSSSFPDGENRTRPALSAPWRAAAGEMGRE